MTGPEPGTLRAGDAGPVWTAIPFVLAVVGAIVHSGRRGR